MNASRHNSVSSRKIRWSKFIERNARKYQLSVSIVRAKLHNCTLELYSLSIIEKNDVNYNLRRFEHKNTYFIVIKYRNYFNKSLWKHFLFTKVWKFVGIGESLLNLSIFLLYNTFKSTALPQACSKAASMLATIKTTHARILQGSRFIWFYFASKLTLN